MDQDELLQMNVLANRFFSFEKSTLHVTVIVRSVFGIFRLLTIESFCGKVIFLWVFYVCEHVLRVNAYKNVDTFTCSVLHSCPL